MKQRAAKRRKRNKEKQRKANRNSEKQRAAKSSKDQQRAAISVVFLGLFEQRKPRQVVDTSSATVHIERFLVSFLISLWVFLAIVFCSLSGRFGVPYWVHFGRQNRPKSGQVGPKTSLEHFFF